MKEVLGLAKVDVLVGTISGGNGHLHASLSTEDGVAVGGHVFGPMIASGSVEISVGECEDLLFTRAHDERTGFPELVVLDRNTQTESPEPTSHGEDSLGDSSQSVTPADKPTTKAYAFRLVPGEEIGSGLNSFVLKHKLQEPFIITCVGSVTKAVLALGQDNAKVIKL